MRFFKVTAGLCLIAIVGQSQGITIIGTFISSGSSFGGGLGNASGAGNTAGGGDLVSVFNAAVTYWENAILDNHTVHLNFGWQSLTGSTLGVHSLFTQGGSPNRELSGAIRFDSSGTSWFADPTPFDHSEYTTYNEFSANLGGGVMNTGRRYTGATGSASGRIDLFSVALHEIGHSLGLSSAHNSFTVGSPITVTGPRPLAGSVIPTISGAHLNLENALMFPSVSTNRRNLMSDADIIANMEISKFTQMGSVVPEPASMAALGLGVFAILRRRRAR